MNPVKPSSSRIELNYPSSPHSHLRHRSRSPSNSTNPPSPRPDSPMLPNSPLIRSASSSSAAGESAFIAFPPPKPDPSTKIRTNYQDDDLLPERPHRHQSISKLSPRPAFTIPLVFRRRRRLLIAFLSTLFVLSVLRQVFAPTLLLVRFKLVDYAYSEVWGWPLAQRECGFRKEPMVFIKGEREVSIVWEIGKCSVGKKDWSLRWKGEGAEEWSTVNELSYSEMTLDYDGGSLRSVYSTTLDQLEGGKLYSYEILKLQEPVRKYSFPFVGPSSSSPSSASKPQTLHIACLADNQFNLRTFHSILSRVLSTSRSLASKFTPSQFPKRRPHLLLHAGDNVQGPNDLEQWQTDFWDPLTKQLSYNLGSQVPMVLARGNHDWDKSGKNIYVGGLPERREWDEKSRNEGKELDEKRSTYYSFSPHKRVRIIVLDSNLIKDDEKQAQEEWLEWEVGREEWKRASLRIALVHTAPWIEWWNRRAWTDGKEWAW